MALTKINHKGVEIVIADFSNKKWEQIFEYGEAYSKDFLAEGKPQRVLLDQSNIVMSAEVSRYFKASALKVQHLQEKLALVGVTGIQKIVANAIMALVKSNVKMFDTREQAMNWLAEK